jgi:DNA replication ATP-dependent helicase/nuclease Dna2
MQLAIGFSKLRSGEQCLRSGRLGSRWHSPKQPPKQSSQTHVQSTTKQTSLLAISNLHDVKEDIWSPTYSLKGKPDGTIQAVISDRNPPCTLTVTNGPQLPGIKAGRTVAGIMTEHRALTM